MAAKRSDGGMIYPCNKCVYVGTTAKKLKKHKLNHEYEFPCQLCDYVGDSFINLKAHKINSAREHEIVAAEHTKYYCTICDFVTLKKYLLNCHNVRKHAKNSSMCEQCDFRCASIGALKRHVKFKHPGTEHLLPPPVRKGNRKKGDSGPVNCDKRHIQIKHEGLRYTCHLCDYKTVKPGSLRDHIKVKHEGFIYRCDQCDFTVKTSESLVKHVKVKHEGKGHPCPFCDFFGGERANLRIHMAKIHPGETVADDFQCHQECKKFNDCIVKLKQVFFLYKKGMKEALAR